MITIVLQSGSTEVRHTGRVVKIQRASLMLDGHEIARKWETVNGPWLLSGHGTTIETISIFEIDGNEADRGS